MTFRKIVSESANSNGNLFRELSENMMEEFQTVAKVGDIPEGTGRSFAVNGTMVGVFLSQGRYLAINDFCPHMGASLADGHVENDAVMCPWHAWRFSLNEAQMLKMVFLYSIAMTMTMTKFNLYLLNYHK